MAEQAVKLKKKQWYPIIAPKLFSNIVLGETLVSDPNTMLNKTLSNSLMGLTNDVKRQNVNIHFKVMSVEDNKAKTMVTGYELVNSSVKRLVRRSSEKMDLSFNCETSDNVWLRVKPVAVTRAAVKGTVAARLRRTIVKFVTEFVKKQSYEQLLTDLITYRLQSEMRAALNKVYPLKVCEIRYLGIEEKNRMQEAKPETKEEIKAQAKAETEEKTEVQA